MRKRYLGFIYRLFFALVCTLSFAAPMLADEGHDEHNKPKKETEMHHHSPSSKNEPALPPGTKEVKIELSGPFCHKHPEEITDGLMKLDGVVHVEAFSGRKYILVHYDGDKAPSTQDMATVVSGLKGSGWRCKGAVSTKRRTER